MKHLRSQKSWGGGGGYKQALKRMYQVQYGIFTLRAKPWGPTHGNAIKKAEHALSPQQIYALCDLPMVNCSLSCKYCWLCVHLSNKPWLFSWTPALCMPPPLSMITQHNKITKQNKGLICSTILPHPTQLTQCVASHQRHQQQLTFCRNLKIREMGWVITFFTLPPPPPPPPKPDMAA